MGDDEPHPALAGQRILVVEDEFVIAMQIADLLEGQRSRVIGPASTVETALRLLALERPDAATLDINLRGHFSIPVAESLREQGVPFVVVSGYSPQSAGEPALEEAAWVRKPFSAPVLLDALQREIDRGRD